MRGPQLLACVAAAMLAAQPFAIYQVGAGQLGSGEALLQVRDGLGVEVLGIVVASQQRLRPGEQPERPRGTGRGRPFGEPPERGLGQPGLTAARGGLHQVVQHNSGERGIVLLNAEHTMQRRLVVAQAELEHHQAILGPDALRAAAAAGRLAGDSGRHPARVRIAAAPGQLVHFRYASCPDDSRVPGGR